MNIKDEPRVCALCYRSKQSNYQLLNHVGIESCPFNFMLGMISATPNFRFKAFSNNFGCRLWKAETEKLLRRPSLAGGWLG